MSFNTPSRNQDWVVDQNFQYEVWSDSDKTLALHYGAIESESAGVPRRYSYLLDADGRMILEYTGVSVGAHPEEVLEDCQAIYGQD